MRDSERDREREEQESDILTFFPPTSTLRTSEAERSHGGVLCSLDAPAVPTVGVITVSGKKTEDLINLIKSNNN